MPPWCTCLFCICEFSGYVGWENEQRFKTRAKPLHDPFFCDVFALVVVCARSLLLWSIKSHDVGFYICDLNLEVIEKFQANNYRLPHWKKTVPFAHGNFLKFALEFLVKW